MSTPAISLYQSNPNETNPVSKFSTWNSRSVVVADKAYQNKQSIDAGVGTGNDVVSTALDVIYFVIVLAFKVLPTCLVMFAGALLGGGVVGYVLASSTAALIGGGITAVVAGVLFWNLSAL